MTEDKPKSGYIGPIGDAPEDIVRQSVFDVSTIWNQRLRDDDFDVKEALLETARTVESLKRFFSSKQEDEIDWVEVRDDFAAIFRGAETRGSSFGLITKRFGELLSWINNMKMYIEQELLKVPPESLIPLPSPSGVHIIPDDGQVKQFDGLRGNAELL